MPMANKITFEALKAHVSAGQVDTVLACIVDMQGRLQGKRFVAQHFVETAWRETHCCNYLLATDLAMATPDGYAATSWKAGYGDYMMRPDLDTLRPVPWLEGTVMVLCDVMDHHGLHEIAHAPRAMLKAQIARAEAHGLSPVMATELEFFLFARSFAEIAASGYRDLEPICAYNQDYSILLTGRDEHVMRPLRNHLFAAGIPVENSKGEAEAGQQELNIRYAPALDTADHHCFAKHATKEIADQHGHAASFLPKWHQDRVGSAAHVHQSLWHDGQNVFFDPEADLGMSDLMRHYMAGLIRYAPDMTAFMAPYINSYKRFAKASFAPTKTVWSVDNRTAGFRLCGADSAAIRVECRIPGSDMNPYLVMAAMIAAGMAGIEEGLELQPPVTGDVYEADQKGAEIPRNLRDAVDALRQSQMLRDAMGDAVIDHYTRAGEWEIEEFDRAVTDYEIARGFERA